MMSHIRYHFLPGLAAVIAWLLVTAPALAQSPPATKPSTRPATAAPAWAAIEPNVPYDQYEATVLDVLWPKAAAAGKRPGVVVFHGGGWIRSTKETTRTALCLPYLERGFVVCNVEYRVAPQGVAPAAVTDALTATKWFFDHADKYNIDPARIVITGASAGGHLALMAGMTPASANLGPAIRPAAIVNGYGITDVPDVLAGPHRQSWAAEWLPDSPGRADLARRVSPLTYVRKDLPPILTVHGAADNTVPPDHARRLTQALKDAGADAELVLVPGAKHGFSREQWVDVNRQIFEFLGKRGIWKGEAK